MRTWSKNWWENPNKKIERIENKIKLLIQNDVEDSLVV